MKLSVSGTLGFAFAVERVARDENGEEQIETVAEVRKTIPVGFQPNPEREEGDDAEV